MEYRREPVFNIPAVIVILIAVMVAIHVAMAVLLTPEQAVEALLLFAFIPARYAADFSGMVWPGGVGAEIWTFVTYALLHADVTHLLFNMVWLLAFGTPVARRFGPARFLLLMIVTAAAGAVAHLIAWPGEMLPMIGASAAISGAMAAAMRFAFQSGGPLGLLQGQNPEAYRVPAVPLSRMLRNGRVLIFLVVWFGVNALMGMSTFSMPGVQQNVAWQAHIGGFLAGLFFFTWFDPFARGSGPPLAPDDAPPSATME